MRIVLFAAEVLQEACRVSSGASYIVVMGIISELSSDAWPQIRRPV